MSYTRELQIVAIIIILTILFVLISPLNNSPIRIILGITMVLFLPGYALVEALFPGKNDLDGIERLALSFGLSIAVVPLFGLGLDFTPFGIRLVLILISLSVFTLATWKKRVFFTPENTGENLKLEFILYKEDNFTIPYRDFHLLVKVK